MRNIELKASLENRETALAACDAIGAVFQGDIHQTDTYFAVTSGRLKLREARPGNTELVQYFRPDVAGPKGCDYRLETVSASIKPLLADALGVLQVVEKTRSLYLWKNVRIHLDSVVGLGEFIEFEAVMQPDEDDADGLKALHYLIETFQIGDDAHQEYAYLELLNMNGNR